jgi:hypothetical protein
MAFFSKIFLLPLMVREEEKDERGSGILGRSHFWSHRIIA